MNIRFADLGGYGWAAEFIHYLANARTRATRLHAETGNPNLDTLIEQQFAFNIAYALFGNTIPQW